MKTIIELDERDIKQAIAEKFGCEAGQVDICTKTVCRGYGMMEHDEIEVTVRIDKDRKVEPVPSLNQGKTSTF